MVMWMLLETVMTVVLPCIHMVMPLMMTVDGTVDEDVKVGWSLVTIDTQSMNVYEINTSNASVSSITGIQSGLTANSMDVGRHFVHSNAGSTLYSFDVCQGTGVSIGTTGVGAVGGILLGKLYGLNSEQSVQTSIWGLWGTTSATMVWRTTAVPKKGCLTESHLYSRNTEQRFVSTSVPFASVGLEFDHSTGLLLASTGSQRLTLPGASGDIQWHDGG